MSTASAAIATEPTFLQDGDYTPIACSVYRGGTSKGLFLRREDLPRDPHLRDAMILTLFGSPDSRQIDGLGGADPLTSKLAIVSPSVRSDADVDFTFGQVSLTEAHIDYRSTCGNISSAVGCFAIDQGWVLAVEPVTTVRIWNTNSQRLLIVEVPVRAGRSAQTGACQIAGVPGSGPCIRLDFGDVVGTVTGRLLPTGNAQERIHVEGAGEVPVSVVDAGSACLFISPESVGIPANIMPSELRSHPTWLSMLESIRGEVACRLGLVAAPSRAAQETPAVPKLLMVSPSQAYEDSGGHWIDVNDVDLLGRALSNQKPHQAYPVTGALATATAAHIPGTLVYDVVRPGHTGALRIGHPGGVIKVDVSIARRSDGWHLEHAIVERTARQLMHGYGLLPWDKVRDLEKELKER